MVAVLVCTMYYTSLKCKTSWGVRKNSSCMVLATALRIHSREKKQTAPFPRGSHCALWGEASGHRGGQLETTNTEASQERANCKLRVGQGCAISSEQVSFQPGDDRGKESFLRTQRDVLELIQQRRN